MEEPKKLSYLVQTSYFYKDAPLDIILQGIDDAINKENFYEDSVYINVLHGVKDYNRVDVLKEIYVECKNREDVYKELTKSFMSQCFMSGNYALIDFLIDQGVPIGEIDGSMNLALPKFPLELLKKIHENCHNLTAPDLHLMAYCFKLLPAKFENIDYLLGIGCKIEDDYHNIVRSCFTLNCTENKDKLDYLCKHGVDLNRENNLLLLIAIQSNMYELIDYVLSKKIDLTLAEEHVEYAFSSCFGDDDVKMLDYMLNKGLKFNINNNKFVEYLARADAINVFNYCIPLGIDIEKIKLHAGPKLKELFTTELYNQMNNSVKSKDENIVAKSSKVKI